MRVMSASESPSPDLTKTYLLLSSGLVEVESKTLKESPLLKV